MVRKMLSVLGIAFVSLFVMGGAASAQSQVLYPPTPPPVVINITVNITIINNGTIIIFSGGGFDPLEGIIISAINTSLPSGLRSSSTLSKMAAATMTTSADEAGNFSEDVTSLIDSTGVWELTATGVTSGKSASATVTKAEAAEPAYVTGGGSVGSSSSSSGALASTGASVAGPIAIGAAALFAGLAMLFFGTRGVIRRKGSRSGGMV